MTYSLLHCHSQFSLLNGLAEPEDIVLKCKEVGIKSVAITDIGSVSGMPQFLKYAKKHEIKPILGCELLISDYESTIVVLSLNKTGWQSLMKIVSFIHTSNNKIGGDPAISMDDLKALISKGNMVCLFGAPRTVLYTQIFYDDKQTCRQLDIDEVKVNHLKSNWVDNCKATISTFQDIFGQGNVYLEALANDSRPAFKMALDGVRYLGNKLGVPVVASTDTRYCNRHDAADFRTMLCIDLECVLDASDQAINRKARWELHPFFDSFNYYIHTYDELRNINTQDELNETNLLADRVEVYDIIPKQAIPQFPCPNNMSADEYLMQLCREGWVKRGIGKKKNELFGLPTASVDVYAERVKREFAVFSKAGLCSYFLIVADYVNKAKERGELVGCGRGSAAGCLISYLLGITEVDPIPFGLIFERFYNEGRNKEGHVSMPDIDMDFPSLKRQHTIDYIKDKYGNDKVAQVVTFIKGKGRGILKDVLRVSGRCDFELMNKMTEHVPDEAAISDKLQEMEELTGESSIIRWALENNPDDFVEWVVLDDDGNLSGDYAKEFAQAIRLEGMRKAYGKHAAGLIVSSSVLEDVAPIFMDKSGSNKVIGFEFKELEELGFVKFDILGVTLLDKLMGVNKILAGGDFEDE